MVTHPFHPLAGRRLRVLFSAQTRRGLLFVCDVGGASRVTLRQEWTDQGPSPADERLSVDGLIEARVLIDALACRSAETAIDGE